MSCSVLLVGLGQVSMGYDLHVRTDDVVLTHARAFSTHPAFRLVGGVDPQEDRRRLLEKHYGASAFADLEDGLAANPDVVVLATPTETHSELLQSVLRNAAPKAILCEKPLSYRCDEAVEMTTASVDRNCALYVNYMRRASPGVLEIKRRLGTGAIAGPIKGTAWYTKGLLNNGSHFVNLLEFWLGAIESFELIERGRAVGTVDCESDVRINFAGGSVTMFSAREENYSLHEIDLIAANGRLRYSQGGGSIVWQATVPDTLAEGYTVLADPGESIESGIEMAQWHVADQLAAALDGLPCNLCTAQEALRTLEWLTKIRDSK
jgi:predicted dehydrogenase